MRVSALLPGVALAMLTAVAVAQGDNWRWVETFEASPAKYTIPLPKVLPKKYAFLARTGPVTGTLRYRFGISMGGTELRVRFSNEVGTVPLKVAAASVGLARGSDMDSDSGSMRQLTFGGSNSIVIPVGAPALSDPVTLPVKADSDLVVSILVRDAVGLEPFGGATELVAAGDRVMSVMFPATERVVSRPLVTAVLVKAASPARVIVALGDSITDGVRSSSSVPHGWVADLARRLNASKDTRSIAVVSAGIGGNRLLADGLGSGALARADRDVFSVPGLKYVILLEGINDIGLSGVTQLGSQPPVDAHDLIGAYKQIASRSHARGVKIFAGTLMPFQGASYYTKDKEAVREAVNRWIRGSTSFDGVIDFAEAMRDRAMPKRLAPKFDSGDHLHPSSAGYAAMAEAIDLALFKSPQADRRDR